MNIPIEQFIPSGAGLVAAISGLIGIWFKFQNRIDNLEKENFAEKTEYDRQINALWEWRDEHEKMAIEIREKFNREISEIRGSLLVTHEQYRQMIDILNDIKDRISVLEKK